MLYLIKGFLREMMILLSHFVGSLSRHKDVRIVFDSFLGKQYSCNPRAVYEYMLAHYPKEGIRYIWAFRDPQEFNAEIKDPQTTVCRFYSLRHLWYACTADVQINNFNMIPAERRRQIRVETWHGGGCYKKTGVAIGYHSRWYNRYLRKKYARITCFVSSSRFWTDNVIRKQFEYTGEVLEIGMPRNDRLFHAEQNPDAAVIRQKLSIPENRFLVLIAPTYRDTGAGGIGAPDYERIARAVERRFGKPALFLYREHHMGQTPLQGESVADVSRYPDMQDLLLISDMLISDYSSSIWDYSFTFRPCFLYTPDLAEYERVRGFDLDIHEWGFPVCEDDETLEKAILSFDEETFRKNMERHHAMLGSFENGHATENLCRMLADRLGIRME